MKRILVIKAHPREISFCNALVDRYIAGVKNNHVELKVLTLNALKLQPWLMYDWGRNHHSVPTSPDIERAKKLIVWSDHIVFAYPTYWTTPPALLKLFIEMIVVSGFAFKYYAPLFGFIPRWHKLLKGRTASILSTMDAPPLFMELHDRDPGGIMMRDTLRFTGIKLIGKYYFGSVVLSSDARKKRWLTRAYYIGKKEGRL
ncbi:MAG: NAD(P)H-dependent oxidoreductase [Patescibacteria group bacterium]|nr:NAD(P)H-dependent oxidoreductase [Patescibacteria group bacterium]MDE2438233.1 NAD(P)H-dependent oxidoreductase [Patescibacteria group bacterium]